MLIACVDGGLFCGPILYLIIVALLGWLGFRQNRCQESGCEHKCHPKPETEFSRGPSPPEPG